MVFRLDTARAPVGHVRPETKFIFPASFVALELVFAHRVAASGGVDGPAVRCCKHDGKEDEGEPAVRQYQCAVGLSATMALTPDSLPFTKRDGVGSAAYVDHRIDRFDPGGHVIRKKDKAPAQSLLVGRHARNRQCAQLHQFPILRPRG